MGFPRGELASPQASLSAPPPPFFDCLVGAVCKSFFFPCSTVPSRGVAQSQYMQLVALLLLRSLRRCLSFGPPRFFPLLTLLLSL